MDPEEPPQSFNQIIETSFIREELSSQDGLLVFGLLLIIGGLLFFSALFSASENAFFSLSPFKRKELSEAEDGPQKAADFLLRYPRKLLATILIANNFVNVAIILISTIIFNSLFNMVAFPLVAFVLQVIIVTFVIVVLGEVIPKVYASANNEKIVQVMAVPLFYLNRILTPFVWLLESSGKLLGANRSQLAKSVTSDELEAVIDLTTEENDAPEEKNMLKGIVNFGQKAVKEIMTPRMNIMAVEEDTGFELLVAKINEWGYSRIPIFNENLDTITGLIFIKDLIPNIGAPDSYNWRSLLRKPFYVPENKKIDDLLTEFKEKKVHLAIVVDEFGGTSGLVTMEDILEEIFGEINDEFDDEEFVYTKLDENTYVFEGKISLNDLGKISEVDVAEFDDVRGESDTLGGLILELTGELPKSGEVVDYGRFRFFIESVDRRRIKRVKFVQLSRNDAEVE